MEAFARQLGSAVAVGAVGPRWARLWTRAPAATEPLEVEVLRHDGAIVTPVTRGRLVIDAVAREQLDHTWAFTIPDDVAGLGPLDPDRAYVVRVRHAHGEPIGEGRFHTPWEGLGPASGRLTFGVASCHQPFDGRGRLQPASVRMLAAAERALRRHDARFLLLVGDQIYADYPPTRSLFRPSFFRKVAPPGRHAPTECTRAEIRRLYQERHRIFFGVEAFAKLQAGWPSYPILDDHEIRDNFGTDPDDVGGGWPAVREGALDAFYDYQASRVLPRVSAAERPAAFYYGFSYGPVAVFVTDIRSQRVADEETVHVFGEAQLSALSAFLERHADHPALCVVVTVPIVHIESWMAGALAACSGHGSDAADRWTYPKTLSERDALLRILREHQRAHPAQRLTLIGGDIHVGSAFRLDWTDGGPPTYQLTASALSHVQSRATRWVAERAPRTTQGVELHDGLTADVNLISPANGAARNPYGGLNFGIVEVAWGARAGVRFKLIGSSGGSDEPATVFESPLL